jgi:hypothetical protein
MILHPYQAFVRRYKPPQRSRKCSYRWSGATPSCSLAYRTVLFLHNRPTTAIRGPSITSHSLSSVSTARIYLPLFVYTRPFHSTLPVLEGSTTQQRLKYPSTEKTDHLAPLRINLSSQRTGE